MRAVMNGVMYILSTGCQWRYLPKDFPPRSTVHDYFVWWHCDGTLDRIHHALYVECREKGEREASPTACHHRQSEREKRRKRGACIDPHGFDAGKLIKGKKRHILVDTLGLLLHAIVHSAGHSGSRWRHLLLATLFGKFPFLEKLFADSAYQGPIFDGALAENPALTSKPKSSNDPIKRKGSCSYPSVGSSNAPSLGSTVAAASPRTGKISTATPLRS